ncbi:hypothetical protein [Leisingera sp. S232]|uniref:hypothetical protein n=1 Tax=Leisingera sp. S232 TaxID=3415132 RepID=UPI0026AE08AB
MSDAFTKFYIDGAWADPASPAEHQVINPATEQVAAVVSLGKPQDVEDAIQAAKCALRTFGPVIAVTPCDRSE